MILVTDDDSVISFDESKLTIEISKFSATDTAFMLNNTRGSIDSGFRNYCFDNREDFDLMLSYLRGEKL